MKSKLLTKSLSLLLALMLCVSVFTPAISAAEAEVAEVAADAEVAEVAANKEVAEVAADAEVAEVAVDKEVAEVAVDAEIAVTAGDGDVLEFHAANAKISRTNLRDIFGDSLLSTAYYGFAPADNAENITYVTATSSPAIAAGEYIALKTTTNAGSIISPKPDWSKATSLSFSVRCYYNAAFAVVGSSDGALYLNGISVTGSAKLYTDTNYTVTAEEVGGYSCGVTGVTLNEEFTPSADLTVTAEYVADSSASVSLNVSEGGTARILVDGEEVAGTIPSGAVFTVEATPNTKGGYKLDSIVVTKGGEEIEGTQFGPVADGEEYAVAVSFVFDPDVVNYEGEAPAPKLYPTSDFYKMFGSESGTYSYGYKKVGDDSISSVSLLGTSFEAGEYLIYRTSMSITNPNWSQAKVLKMVLRTYYTATFTVSGHDDGEIYLNGSVPENGTAKLYTDETYVITTKGIEENICTLYGAVEGEEFTPTEDLYIQAVYMKEAYATVTVNASEGGTVSLVSGGEAVMDKIPEGSSFEVIATANANNDYYVESIVVTKDGEEVEGVDNVYGPVADGESYEVTVTFARATLTLDDCDVSLVALKEQNYAAVEEAILANAHLTPAEYADGAVTEVGYAAYTILSVDIYEPLNFTGALSHAFGTSEYGGELFEGNTEKIRVIYQLPDLGIKLNAYATATVRDDRAATRVEGDTITITYGDDLKAAVMDAITVYNEEDEIVEFSDSDITLDPESLNAKPLTAQEVAVTYGGNDYYAASVGSVSVYVQRAQSSIDTKSEIITYGQTPAAEVIVTPEDLDYIKVIGGIDGDAKGFVSIDIPQSVKDKMKLDLGIFTLDFYEMLQEGLKDGASLTELRNVIGNIYSMISQSETISEIVGSNGIDMTFLSYVMEFVESLPETNLNLNVYLNQVPVNAGVYLLGAISTDSNYTLSADVSYIIIKPQTDTDETSVELRFRNEIEDELNVLSYEEAQTFGFGGEFYVDGEYYETDKIHAVYAGVTFGGDAVAQAEPITLPGVYTETIYLLGGNYLPEPIIRTYTVARIPVELMMDDLTVTYDGEPHTTVPYYEDGTELTGVTTYIYSGTFFCGTYYSNIAPVNVGEYTVYAYYSGDGMRAATYAVATLIIEPADMTVISSGVETVYDGEPHSITVTCEDPDTALVLYSTDGENYCACNPAFTDAGTYEVFYKVKDSNFNTYTGSETVVIGKASFLPAVTIEGWTYGEEANAPVVSDNVSGGEETVVYAGKSDLDALDPEDDNYIADYEACWSADVPENAGEYVVSVKIAETENYNAAVCSADFTIVKATLTVAAQNQTVNYGAAIDQSKYTVKGLVQGDTITVKLVVSMNRNTITPVVKASDNYIVKTVIALMGTLNTPYAMAAPSGAKIAVSWVARENADGYLVCAAYRGENVYETVADITDGSAVSYTITKLHGKALDTTKNVLLQIYAYKNVNGKKIKIVKSTTLYVAGANNTAYTNVVKLTVPANTLTLKVGKTYKIKATATLADKTKKELSYTDKLRYSVSHSSICTVSSDGTIKAVSKGVCNVYVYTQNGVRAKIQVTVE